VKLKKSFYIICVLLTWGCPEKEDPLECGSQQVELNNECNCVEGYHWNTNGDECVLDTTRHGFIWTIDTIGLWGSRINDVVIIDENNIWAGGYIKVPDPDSSFNGTGKEIFNAIHWDGNEWKLYEVDRYVRITDIFAFSETDMWFVNGCYVYHFDGESFTNIWVCDWEVYGPNQTMYIWGTSSENLFFIGDNGSIVHYDGIDFEVMDSGTDLHLRRIAGTDDGSHLFVSGKINENGVHGTIVLEYEESNWSPIYQSEVVYGDPENGDYGWAQSIDLFGDTLYIATVSEFMYVNIHTKEYRTVHTTDEIHRYGYGTTKVQNANDIMMFHGGGKVVHYNGNTWKILEDFRGATYYGGDLKGEIAAYVGSISNGPAIIAIGRRE